MSDEPTVGEQLRRLADRIELMQGQMSQLLSSEKHSYELQIRDLADAARDERIARIEEDAAKNRDQQLQTRRIVWTSFLIPLGLILLQFYLSSWSK